MRSSTQKPNILQAYSDDREVQEIIGAQGTGEWKAPAPLRKTIKLELGNCKAAEDPITWIKHLLVRDKMYVPGDKDDILRTDAIRSQHDPPTAGYPGRAGTLEKV